MKITTLRYCAATGEDFEPFQKVVYVHADNNCVTVEVAESIRGKKEDRLFIPANRLEQHIKDCVRKYEEQYGAVAKMDLLNDLECE
ncbi:hypothetical protein DFP93_102154 [Aneurinibacillus soli]|uniref:Uncharacterized protein n=1 Tax=Aneurinibacillus soli TaxID=1500254 RepID=A0A0U5BHG2_9BACL|nr:hypothetical protein [Aneurinibacillus soli]PYE63470.1 hypothetical protein DFP93_102154 [Aneurinibacillus soli]BAU27598.1 hypothetical protein CB4_01772 [Aneurinibacillus soli]